MRTHTFLSATLLSVTALCSACGGGGGGGGASSGDGERELLVVANVVNDTCGERLSQVRQVFSVTGATLDSGLFTVPYAESGGNLETTYSDQNGDCVRNYTVTLGDFDRPNGTAKLISKTTCAASACETTWQGIFEETAVDKENVTKVRGENCNPNVPTVVGYRASAFECNGAAAVLLGGSLRNNYSVVVRRNGQFNDRDPENPTCGTNRCSPYKTQKRIELPPYQVNCLGANGFDPKFAGVNRISIKFTAAVVNANDESQFEQYCLNSVTAPLN